MNFELLTIFPDIYSSFLQSGLIHKATERALLSFNLVNIRDFSAAPHFQVDDAPYGGGAGMLMKAEPLTLAIEASKQRHPKAPVILFSPRGEPFSQNIARELSKLDALILVSARYEGIDQRVSELAIDREISLGDFILMGGEVASMALIEAVVRLVPGVIGNSDSSLIESFSQANEILLEAPQYTRPADFRGLKVPEVLLSGDPKLIKAWQKKQALQVTKERRPDLLTSSLKSKITTEE